MIDVTGSMTPYINMARDKIQDIIDDLYTDQYDRSKSEARIGIVAYRDQGDLRRFEIMDFTSSGSEATSFLASLEATGGDDLPEDVNGAFQEALYDMDWMALTRYIYHLADAPAHGDEFHDLQDDHPQGLSTDLPWETLFSSMRRMNINYYYFIVLYNNYNFTNSPISKILSLHLRETDRGF